MIFLSLPVYLSCVRVLRLHLVFFRPTDVVLSDESLDQAFHKPIRNAKDFVSHDLKKWHLLNNKKIPSEN